ncbi:kinase-like protein, partial [Macrolepiota fuliginosa MF-IS2]
ILALHDIHSRGVVHRDIKFQNIMLHYGHIKLIDFGGDAFPLLFPGVYNPFTIIHPCGTRGFSAPEVWKEEKYSFGVDYFAVGSILHTFLTRKVCV